MSLYFYFLRYRLGRIEADMLARMMYNFPGVSSGIDLDSDLIIDIAKRSSNVCGVKLT